MKISQIYEEIVLDTIRSTSICPINILDMGVFFNYIDTEVFKAYTYTLSLQMTKMPIFTLKENYNNLGKYQIL